MMVNVRPMMAPPPRPWRPRARISWFIPSRGMGRLPAAPQSHDDTMKRIAPER